MVTGAMPIFGAMLALIAASATQAVPFPAWVGTTSAYIRSEPRPDAPAVGLVLYGDGVTVVGCAPACDAKDAWALLDGAGAVRLALLRTDPRPRDAEGHGATARYTYGKALRSVPVRAEPTSVAHIVRHETAGRVLAFRTDESLRETGWLERPDGGFVRVDDVKLSEPSAFAGERDPTTPIAFVVRRNEPLPRYARAAVLGVDAARHVVTAQGTLARASVRLAFTRPRPAAVPEGARWVHVDLSEQVLGAYEGDRLVFATLISAGRVSAGHPTAEGLFRVWMKAAHQRMRGHEEEPYDVDAVPDVMFFRRGFALHGAFWHDAFGTPVSHGCVNLSLADAAWLFAWAPPALPDGWHAALPLETDRESLWVQVEHAKALPLPRVDGTPEG